MKNSKLENEQTNNIYKLALSGRLPHAILLEIDDISTKGLKVALNIAKALFCCAEFETRPCGKCTACKKVASKIHPDLKIVEAKKNYKTIRVDDIRELRLEAYLMPNEAKYKVYIINDGSLMNDQAQNVFLKILEEPPEKVKFIIICQSRFSMLPTVRSRTQIFEINTENVLKPRGKIQNIVNQVIESVANRDSFEILKATSGLAKDRDSFIKVLKELDYIISNLCLTRVEERKFTDCPQLNSVSLERLLKIREKILKIKDLLDKNVNTQLAACEFCIGLSE